jgi:hypothetical protein
MTETIHMIILASALLTALATYARDAIVPPDPRPPLAGGGIAALALGLLLTTSMHQW